MTAVVLASLIAGSVPQTLVAPSRVVWMDGNAPGQTSCRLASPTRWECETTGDQPHGLVVIVGENGVAYAATTADDRAFRTKRWGRAVVVTAGAVTPDDIRDVRISAWAPERSRSRLQSKRFAPAKDTTVDILRVAGTTFWIAGDDTDPEAFLVVDGPAIGSTRIAISTLADGPPETPIYLPAAMPFSLVGRVQTPRGEDVANTDVELFQPLATQPDDPSVDLASQSLIRIAVTRSDQDGRFSFDRLSTGPFLVSVLDGTRGRGTVLVRSLGEPVVIRLIPPATASGRVLRNRLPVAGARVRFIPNAEAFLASADVMDLAAEERATDAGGRFSFQLPPITDGTIQVIAPDGTSVRVQVSRPKESSRIDLGDITLPDQRRLTVRLLDGIPCVLSAVGPVGALGLTIIRAASFGAVHVFDIPEPGQWALDAECEGRNYSLDPLVVTVQAVGPDASIDVRLVK